MQETIIFIADLFDIQINGGAELNDRVLINFLKADDKFKVIEINSADVTPQIIKKNNKFLISNFVVLSDTARSLLQTKDYIIYEHDHKYVNTRDPSVFANFDIPDQNIINRQFYQNAKAVVVLSKICKQILEKNLNLNNVYNIGTSLWSEERLQHIETLTTSSKNSKFAIINSTNKIKGTPESVEICQQKNIEYDLIGPLNPNDLLETLASYKGLLFFPKVLETFSRISAEAKMLNCSLLTKPKMLGFASEDIYSLAGQELIDEIRERVSSALELFVELLKAPVASKSQEEVDITVILNCYRRPEYLHEQIASIRQQSCSPKEIWIWVNYHEDNSHIDFDSFGVDKVIKNDYNWKFYGRFAAALLARTQYIALFDDDTIPGRQWFENCLTTTKTHPGILGGIGVILKEDKYYGHDRVGWSAPNSDIEEVDLVGHAWFMERSTLRDLWREEPYCWDNGEDIQLSYLAQKYSGTKTYVPAHPIGKLDMYSSLKGMQYGVDEKATSRPTNHQVFYTERDNCVKNAIKNGWDPLFKRNK